MQIGTSSSIELNSKITKIDAPQMIQRKIIYNREIKYLFYIYQTFHAINNSWHRRAKRNDIILAKVQLLCSSRRNIVNPSAILLHQEPPWISILDENIGIDTQNYTCFIQRHVDYMNWPVQVR